MPEVRAGVLGAEGGGKGMTYLEKLMSAVKVDDELLTSCEAELLRDSLSKFFNHCLVMSSCPGHFFTGASHFRYRCDFGFDCVRCWNQEA